MKTPPIDPIRIKRVQELTYLRAEATIAAVTGNYKKFKESSKAFAKTAIEDFEAVKNLPPQKPINFPLFSKTGLNMLKVWLLNKLRIKTPEEKQFAQWGKIEKERRKIETLKNDVFDKNIHK